MALSRRGLCGQLEQGLVQVLEIMSTVGPIRSLWSSLVSLVGLMMRVVYCRYGGGRLVMRVFHCREVVC